MTRESKHLSVLLVTFGVLFIFALSCPSEASIIASPILVVGQNSVYDTTLIASSDTGGTIKVLNCGAGPGPSGAVVAGGALLVEHLGTWLCMPPTGLGWLPVVTTGDISPITVLDFDDGSRKAQFSVPVLTDALVADGQVGTFTRIQSTKENGCYVVFVNTGATEGAVTITLYDKDGAFVERDYTPIPKGVSGFSPAGQLSIGRIDVVQGYINVGPNPPLTTIYGFAAIGPADGHTQRIEPMKVH